MDSSNSSSRVESITAVTALGLFALAVLLLAWVALPDRRKSQMNLMLLRSWRRALSLHARRTAVQSMARELRTGRQDYEASYRLAMAVDRVDARINMITAGLS